MDDLHSDSPFDPEPDYCPVCHQRNVGVLVPVGERGLLACLECETRAREDREAYAYYLDHRAWLARIAPRALRRRAVRDGWPVARSGRTRRGAWVRRG